MSKFKHWLLSLFFIFVSIFGFSQSVSLTFSNGFVGTQGNSTNAANNIKTLGTMGVARVSFSQNYSGSFGGTQGNDLDGTVKLYLKNGASSSSGSVITLTGALNWRETSSGNTLEIFGFIFDQGQNASITYNGQTYNITGGTVANTSSTLGLKAYAGTITLTDGANISGNAATNDLITALNNELTSTPQPSTITLTNSGVIEGQNLVYTVTLNTATLANKPQVYTLAISGSAINGSDYNSTYSFSNSVVNNGDGTITVPGGVSSFTITVATIDDIYIESIENLVLTIGNKSALGSLKDNDVPTSPQCEVNNPYDKIVSGYHQSIALKTDASFAVWGEDLDRTGAGNVLTPLDMNVTNFPGLVGTPLKATIGGKGGPGEEQAILLTSDGLYAWGNEGYVIDNALTTNKTFAKVLVNQFTTGNANANTGLPAEVNPYDVKMMTASYGTLIILTNAGDVWTLSNLSGNLNANGSSTVNSKTWYKVKTNSSTYLSVITAVRVQASSSTKNAVIALKADGTVYTWGSSTYLGNASASAALSYATQMTLPAEFSITNIPKMIAVTGGVKNSSYVINSYYILSNSGALYSLGYNGQKQLGNFSTTESQSWVNAKMNATTDFSNVTFITAQEHDASFPGIAAVTKNGDLYTWGDNEGLALGRDADGSTYNPGMPLGFTPGTDIALSAEMGGHTLVYLKQGTSQFCYVGHKISGSMGDGFDGSSFINTFNCTGTPSLSICGSVPVSASTTTSTIAATPTPIAADGTTTSTITVRLKDANGNNLTTTGGTVTITSNLGTVGTVTDNNDGTYTATITSNTGGNATISYTINGASGTNTATVVFTTPASPTISYSSTLKPFTSCSGCVVVEQSFSISGTDLTAALVATAPTGFEVSLTSGSNFSSSVSITPTSGTVASTTIYVRVANNNATISNGDITLSSNGATSQTVALTVNTDNALDFDGSSDYVSLANTIFSDGQQNFTLEFWVKPTESTQTWRGLIGGYSNSQTDRVPSIWQFGRKIHFDLVGYGTTTSYGGYTVDVLNIGQWNHIAYIKEGATTKFYVNGQAVAIYQSGYDGATQLTKSAPSSIKAISNYYIGKVDNYTLGSIDEVRFWNAARTLSEITNNMFTELSGGESGLLAYYNFNQGVANGTNTGLTTLTDRSSRGLNGSLNSFTLSGNTSNYTHGFIPSITATNNATTVANAGTLQLSNGLTGGTWSSSDINKATVNSSTGLVTGVNAGTVNITYTVCGKSVMKQITVTAPNPVITTTGTLSAFTICAGTASAEQSFTVAGSNLTADLVLTAPTGYEISQTSGGTFTSSINIQNSGTVSSTTIYVRLKSDAVNGASGNISAASTGATTQNVATGTAVVNDAPADFTITGDQTICLNNTATYTANGNGNALDFDGSNDYVATASNIAALNITSDITLETWVYIDQHAYDWVRLIGKGGNSDRTYGLWLATSGQILLQFYGTSSVGLQTQQALSTGRWYHIAATRSGSSIKIYIDGVETASGTYSGTPTSNTMPLQLGFGNVHTYLNGKMTDVRVWNIARTQSEIANNKDISIAPQAGLVAYYKFNQGTANGSNVSVTTLNDASGNNYHATLSNFALTGTNSNFVTGRSSNLSGTWASSNTSVATIDANGVVTPVAAGTTNIQFTQTNTAGCSLQKTLAITVPAALVAPTGVDGSRNGTGTVAISATVSSGETVDWYAAATGGAILTGGTGTLNFTTPSISSTTTYYAQTRNSTTGCISGTRTAVVATINPSVIAITGTLTNFTSCSGTVSAEQEFVVSGSDLSGNITITAPAGYEMSTTSGGTFSTTVTLTPTSGNVSATTIYVRLASSALNAASGNISAASTGATTATLATGSAVVSASPIAPVVQSQTDYCEEPIVNAYKYAKVVFKNTKNLMTAQMIQLAEWKWFHGNTEISRTNVTVTNPDGNNPGNELPESIYDGNTNTKWLDRNIIWGNHTSTLVFAFPGTGARITGYSWVTANDYEERDPVSWTIYMSNDGISWKQVHSVGNYVSPSARFTESDTWTYVNDAPNSITLSATALANNTLVWYADASGGSALSAAPSVNTSISGNYQYYVSQVNQAGCESPRALLAVNVNALPAAPTISSNVSNASVCADGSVTLTAASTSVSGNNAITLNGTNQNITVASGYASTDDLTIEAWVYPTILSGFRTIVNHDGWSRGYIHFQFHDDRLQFALNGNPDKYSTYRFTINNWYHVAAVYSKSAGTIKFYVNGNLTNTEAANQITIPAGLPFTIGSWSNGRFFGGHIDELRIWNTARTTAEIQNNRLSSVSGSSAGLAAYYKADETSNTVLADATSFARNGSISNNATRLSPTTAPLSSIANFTWDDASASTTASITVTPSQSTLYTVTATDNKGCVSTASKLVNIINGPGRFGNAMHLDGVNDYAIVENNAPAISTNMTIEGWIKTNSNSADVNIVSWGYGLDQINNYGDNAQFRVNAQGYLVWGMQSYSSNMGWTAFQSADVVNDNEWHHVAVVKTGSDYVLYVDGVNQSTYNMPHTVEVNRMAIGAYDIAGSVGQYFPGSLDEVRIWNVAKTESEIRASMNIELAGTEQNLSAYYNFNHGEAAGTNTPLTSLLDISTNVRDGEWKNLNLTGSTSNFVEGYDRTVSEITGTTTVLEGGTTQLSNTVMGGVWALSNTSVGSIDENGLFTANNTGSGTTNVTYTLTSASGNGCSIQKSITLTIDPKALIQGPSGNAGNNESEKSINENNTPVFTFTTNESVTWSLSGGDDVDKFTIDPTTGALRFIDAPDYELPLDSDGNNTYIVVIQTVDDAGNVSEQTVTITVLDVNEEPQGGITAVDYKLLASDSVKIKLNASIGTAPFTLILSNTTSVINDTITGLNDGDTFVLGKKSATTIYSMVKLEDAGGLTRTSGFTKDTTIVNILKPLIVLTLKADSVIRLPDNSFATQLLLRIKNKGELDLNNVQVNANLSNIFPSYLQYKLDSIKVTSGNLVLNPNYTGNGSATTISSVPISSYQHPNTNTGKLTNAVLDGNYLFDNGVNLNVNEEGEVVYYLSIAPTTQDVVLKLQFATSGAGLLTKSDGTVSAEQTEAVSDDGSNVDQHPNVTNDRTPFATYVPLFPREKIGAALSVSEAQQMTGGYKFHFIAKFKNYGNVNLDSVNVIYNLQNAYPSPDDAYLLSAPTITRGNFVFNASDYNGYTNDSLVKFNGNLAVGDSAIVEFDLFVATTRTSYTWLNSMSVFARSLNSGNIISDSSMTGTNPDPSGDNDPIESNYTRAYINYVLPAPPVVNNATYVYGTSKPANISGLVKSTPTGTIPVWCTLATGKCSVTPPNTPTEIGRYIYELRSYDTTTLLYSDVSVYDTVVIKPPVPLVKNATYIIGLSTNPANVSILVTGMTNSTIKYHLQSVALANIPTLGSNPGTVRYTVSQTVNGIESDTVGFNVTMLHPNDVIHLQKMAEEPILQANSTFNITYKFVVNNLIDKTFENVVVTDNLQNTFPSTSNYHIISVRTTGGLVANSSFNGASNQLLTNSTSVVNAFAKDTIILTLNFEPKGFSGVLNNVANVTATTPYGIVDMISSSSSKANEVTKTPTPITIPDLAIYIPEGFSPNHDGVNDNFVIIKPFGTTIELEVFNRWGNVVYQNNNYNNEWNGKGTNNFIGQDLMDGGYYYAIKAISSKGITQTFKGFVIIQR